MSGVIPPNSHVPSRSAEEQLHFSIFKFGYCENYTHDFFYLSVCSENIYFAAISDTN